MVSRYILVTGATGLVGAHVVDNLLGKGFRVKAVARSRSKAQQMIDARPQHADLLDFYYIDDLTSPGAFDQAMEGIDGVIHVASPLNYGAQDKEKELIQPAIQGVQSILASSAKSGKVQRVVMTSSFGAVLDMDRDMATPYTFTAADWNPITYAQAADPSATPQDAYRGSKVFAEEQAWRFVKQAKPSFDLVTLCPSMVFGPVAGPLASPNDLNESDAMIWRVAEGKEGTELPPARFNFWIDVRDLAEIHVQALVVPAAGGHRLIPVAPEKFNYQMASEIIQATFPGDPVLAGVQDIKEHINVNTAEMDSVIPGIQFHTFKETVVDLVSQVKALQ